MTDKGDGIRKSGQGFGIPSGGRERDTVSSEEVGSEQRNERKQTHQRGSGASNRVEALILPLFLPFHLHSPAKAQS